MTGPRDNTHRRHAIHIRRIRSLKRRLAAQRPLWLISRTIGNDNCVLHDFGLRISDCGLGFKNPQSAIA
jgi:hypothetical protein